MSYNWTITDGDIYVSKNGNDTTGDGSMSNPYASINKATDSGSHNNKIVIGTGKWEEARGTSTNNYVFVGDNTTRIDASVLKIRLGDTFVNIKYYSSIIGSTIYSGSTDILTTFINCEISDVFITRGGQTGGVLYYSFDKCIFKNVYWTTYYTHSVTSLVKNSYLENCGTGDYYAGLIKSSNKLSYENCIFNTNKLIPATANNNGLITSSSNYNYCCFSDGLIYGSWATVAYFTHTFTSQQQNSLFLNSIGLDSMFNNSNIGDYTLQSDSPCLFAGKNNSHIGAFGVGYKFDANSSEFTEEGGAAFSQSDIGSGLENGIVKYSANIKGVDYYYFVLNTDHTEGTIESEWIDFQTLYELKAANLFANFIYDEDGVATSRVDMDNNNTGEFPNQYDFEMKYCINEEDKDTTTWNEIIWNKELSNVSARFIKVKIYLKEN